MQPAGSWKLDAWLTGADYFWLRASSLKLISALADGLPPTGFGHYRKKAIKKL
jgi:hypothetical protein